VDIAEYVLARKAQGSDFHSAFLAVER
jgi:hypothetical protein